MKSVTLVIFVSLFSLTSFAQNQGTPNLKESKIAITAQTDVSFVNELSQKLGLLIAVRGDLLFKAFPKAGVSCTLLPMNLRVIPEGQTFIADLAQIPYIYEANKIRTMIHFQAQKPSSQGEALAIDFIKISESKEPVDVFDYALELQSCLGYRFFVQTVQKK